MSGKYEFCDISKLANYALQQQEMDVVTQAVGRVRPFTQPREIITFQASEHPTISYVREFSMLQEAREFFSIPNARQFRTEMTADRVRQAKAAGMSRTATAAALKLSLSTVKRHWHSTGVTKP